jgi:hypothetical protein
MNRISMFSSSEDLRAALHRVMAISHALSNHGTVTMSPPVPPEREVPWWEAFPGLEPAERPAARDLRLSRQRLGELLGAGEGYFLLVRTWQYLGLATPPSAAQLAAVFRDAEISGRAINQHGGRDVYGASNKRIWDLLVTPLAAALASRWGAEVLDWHRVPTEAERAENLEALGQLADLMSFDTRPEGEGHKGCAVHLRDRLLDLGFSVEVKEGAGPPLLFAHRPARGLAGSVVMYGHYDVAPIGRAAFKHPPMQLTQEADEGGAPAAAYSPRLFGRGVADNKGPLAVRLAALKRLSTTPELCFLLQGEEETGSRCARAAFPYKMAALRPTLWLDETGYHDHGDGTLRLLARTLGQAPDISAPPDDALRELLLPLRLLASRFGVATREEWRSLNKSEVEGGCPFNKNLPPGARYLALGINDSLARIHRVDESVPTWTFQLHREELQQLFRWVDQIAQRAA